MSPQKTCPSAHPLATRIYHGTLHVGAFMGGWEGGRVYKVISTNTFVQARLAMNRIFEDCEKNKNVKA
jgi:hypothetical protein